MNNKWDCRFVDLAKHIAGWSKDPSTQVGAVIVDEKSRVVSIGYNGFPCGVDDDLNRYNSRELKYKMIVHAECNAILFAKISLDKCTLYTWPFMSCSRCAVMIIQSGIKRCVAPKTPDRLIERWNEDMSISAKMFKEAGVELVILDN